jgi:bla regulator protein BlaR1
VVASTTGVDFLQDFSVSVTRFFPQGFITVAAVIWLTGAAVFAAALFKSFFELKLLKESVKPLDLCPLSGLLKKAKAEMQVKQNVMLGFSVLVKSPVTMGVLKPFIVIPQTLAESFNQNEMRHILLHELAHIKRRDCLMNTLLCVLLALYWWNPLVYMAFRKIREDSEVCSDFLALKALPEGSAASYGKTVISFAAKHPSTKRNFFAMQMGASGRGLVGRIEKIAEYKTETKHKRVKSMVLFGLIALLIIAQVPVVAALSLSDAGEEYYSFNEPNVYYSDLSPYFDGYKGTFVLYDTTSAKYTIYNRDESTRRVSPASTYKIYSGLIALEEGVITPEKSNIEWNGTSYPIKEWNSGQNLNSGIQNSVSWYFQELDRRVGKEKLEKWFKNMDYGNHNLSGGLDDYWMESSLKISPVEQVKLLTALCQNKMSFSRQNVLAMKNALLLSRKNNAALFGKTGTVTVNGKIISGWFIGFVENAENCFVFALRIEGENAGGGTAAKTALSILSHMGVY